MIAASLLLLFLAGVLGYGATHGLVGLWVLVAVCLWAGLDIAWFELRPMLQRLCNLLPLRRS